MLICYLRVKNLCNIITLYNATQTFQQPFHFESAITLLSTGEFRSAQLSPSLISTDSAKQITHVRVLAKTLNKSLFHHYTSEHVKKKCVCNNAGFPVVPQTSTLCRMLRTDQPRGCTSPFSATDHLSALLAVATQLSDNSQVRKKFISISYGDCSMKR